MFKVDDEVECVEFRPCPFYGKPPLAPNVIYTVREVASDTVRCGLVLYLNEVRGNGPKGGFGAFRFRKVQRKNSRLTLEAFFTVSGGFEEPKRAPAKKKTDA